jgi:hypothetical protein
VGNTPSCDHLLASYTSPVYTNPSNNCLTLTSFFL